MDWESNVQIPEIFNQWHGHMHLVVCLLFVSCLFLPFPWYILLSFQFVFGVGCLCAVIVLSLPLLFLRLMVAVVDMEHCSCQGTDQRFWIGGHKSHRSVVNEAAPAMEIRVPQVKNCMFDNCQIPKPMIMQTKPTK